VVTQDKFHSTNISATVRFQNQLYYIWRGIEEAGVERSLPSSLAI